MNIQQGSIQLGGAGGKLPPPPNVACCVQCLYSITNIIRSAKISSDVSVQ